MTDNHVGEFSRYIFDMSRTQEEVDEKNVSVVQCMIKCESSDE